MTQQEMLLRDWGEMKEIRDNVIWGMSLIRRVKMVE